MLLGVNVAIFKDGLILLTKREDFHVWCMPGGSVDPNETVAQAGIREVMEETGLEVRLTRMVGIYSRPEWSDGGSHIVVFAGEQTGGSMKPSAHEVAAMEWFHPDALPERMLVGQQQRIRDAAAGIGGSVAVCETAIYPQGLPVPRADLYAHRDDTGMARDDFYMQTIGLDANAPPVIEIEGKSG